MLCTKFLVSELWYPLRGTHFSIRHLRNMEALERIFENKVGSSISSGR